MTGDPMTLNDEYASLLLFMKWVLGHSFDGCDINGQDAQEKIVSLGLGRWVAYDPKKHGLATHCVEGDRWLLLNASIR